MGLKKNQYIVWMLNRKIDKLLIAITSKISPTTKF